MKNAAFEIVSFVLGAALAVSAPGCEGSITGLDGTADMTDVQADDTAVDPSGDDAGPLPPPTRVDILVVVDDSGSMAAEQNNLKAAMPALVGALLDPPLDPVTGLPVHAPVRDLHLGVIGTNLGAGGYGVSGCDGLGDDAILLHLPHTPGCDAAYPLFLSYLIGETDPPDLAAIADLSADFGCIAVLGTEGCGFEQPLEAAHKALLVHARPGGPNDGFLRDDSLILIVFITDEEDCSAEDNALFDLTAVSYPVNLRCYHEKDMLHDVSRYVNGFRSLRADPNHVVVGMIVGVPLAPACNGRGTQLADCLDQPSMEETVRPDGQLLEYVCKYPTDCNPPEPPLPGDCMTEAFPARRFVELARGLGENGIVQSICTNNYGPPMEAIASRVAQIIGSE
jgi:hypothetical protein